MGTTVTMNEHTIETDTLLIDYTVCTLPKDMKTLQEATDIAEALNAMFKKNAIPLKQPVAVYHNLEKLETIHDELKDTYYMEDEIYENFVDGLDEFALLLSNMTTEEVDVMDKLRVEDSNLLIELTDAEQAVFDTSERLQDRYIEEVKLGAPSQDMFLLSGDSLVVSRVRNKESKRTVAILLLSIDNEENDWTYLYHIDKKHGLNYTPFLSKKGELILQAVTAMAEKDERIKLVTESLFNKYDSAKSYFSEKEVILATETLLGNVYETNITHKDYSRVTNLLKLFTYMKLTKKYEKFFIDLMDTRKLIKETLLATEW